jgi:hypothetical protein
MIDPDQLTIIESAPNDRLVVSSTVSEEFAAWIARKRRELLGLPLRKCDREQAERQLADL